MKVKGFVLDEPDEDGDGETFNDVLDALDENDIGYMSGQDDGKVFIFVKPEDEDGLRFLSKELDCSPADAQEFESDDYPLDVDFT
jgi:hypothetical protein